MTSYEDFIKNGLVVLTAGGESSRFKGVPGSANVQKAAYVLPNGDTMIERTIKMYRDLGLTKFVLLVYHNVESVQALLGDGSKHNVEISYSLDPGKPVGRGGAMKNAIIEGHIPSLAYLIVHNPDDQIVEKPLEVIETAIKAHLANEERNAIATAIMVEGVKHEFTGFEIENGFVKGSEMYPFIKMPTHIGMTIFSPAVLPYFDNLFSVTEKTDFEAVLFPELTKEQKLAAHLIPEGSWISVNDEKGLKKLIKVLG